MRSISLGEASIIWLLAVMEEVLNTEVAKKNIAGKFSLFSKMQIEVAFFGH
jgi:hypothetical protein